MPVRAQSTSARSLEEGRSADKQPTFCSVHLGHITVSLVSCVILKVTVNKPQMHLPDAFPLFA